MTLKIGVISQKGGVGKSTLSRLIARNYAHAGWLVKIADLDVSQGTSTDWKNRRDSKNYDPEIAVEAFRTIHQAMRIKDVYDLIVFDAPPHSMSSTLEIARVSEMVLLPTGLSLDDLRPSIMLAHELLEQGIESNKILFVLCRVGDRANEISEARAYIEKAGYKCAVGSLPEKTGYRRASDDGRALSETPYPSLKVRAQEVSDSIVEHINLI